MQSKAQVVAHEPTLLKVQLGSADGSLEHTEFRVDFEAIRKDTMQSSGKVIGVTLRYNTPPVAPTPVVWNYDSSQYEVVKAGEKWEADRDGILYWAYDDSITEETDPNCAKWFSINGTRHSVAGCKVEPNVQVDGLSVFSIKTDYSGTTLAALDAEGVASPAIASGQVAPLAMYVIKYDGNGADGGTAPASQNKTQYTNITLATNSGGLTRIGYRFSGWNTAPAGTGTTYPAGATYSADESVTLYAKWEAVNAVVLAPESSAVNHGATVTLTPPTMDATIYYRIGDAPETTGIQGQPVMVTLYNEKYLSPDATGAYAEIPEDDSVTITAYAVYADGTRSTETTGTYRLNQYTVSYDGNGYTGGTVPSRQTFYSGGSVTVQGKSDLTKTGYTFTEWQGNDGQPYSQGNNYGEDKNLTLTAQWDPNTYTVQFDSNGGSSSMDIQKFTYDQPGKLTVNGFIPPAGHEFVGWKGDDDNVYTDEEEVKNLTTEWNGTVTLTAQWGPTLKDSAQVPSGYTSPHAPPPTGSARYVEFGYWPQTVKEAKVTVYTGLSKEVGMFTYYLGSDSSWYVKEDGKYYKVEPIVWRVLTEDYKDPDGTSTGNALLLAEKILTGTYWAYDKDNYMESVVRLFLNSNNGTAVQSDYADVSYGFLQTAFTAEAQKLIAETTVDNSEESTLQTSAGGWGSNPNVCDNTTDKVFLLSTKEATTSEYGFIETSGSDFARIRVPTDYAKNYFSVEARWWLRSRRSAAVKDGAYYINEDGDPQYINDSNIYDGYNGIVPALCIPADQLPK